MHFQYKTLYWRIIITGFEPHLLRDCPYTYSHFTVCTIPYLRYYILYYTYIHFLQFHESCNKKEDQWQTCGLLCKTANLVWILQTASSSSIDEMSFWFLLPFFCYRNRIDSYKSYWLNSRPFKCSQSDSFFWFAFHLICKSHPLWWWALTVICLNGHTDTQMKIGWRINSCLINCAAYHLICILYE